MISWKIALGLLQDNKSISMREQEDFFKKRRPSDCLVLKLI